MLESLDKIVVKFRKKSCIKGLMTISENKRTLVSYMTHPNTIHQKFIKYILGVKTNCSNMATLGELGEFPLLLYRFIALLLFWYRVSLMDGRTLVKQAQDK